MEKSFGQNDPAITRYANETFHPEDPLLQEIHSRAMEAGLPEIQVNPMDGLHLEVITRAMGARKAVEIGTLAGYSGVCICRGMGPSGKLFTFEIDPAHAEVAKESFKRAGFEKNVELNLGPAALTLPRINNKGPFDLVFIDADKETYPHYLRWAAENLRVGGVVLADNTFGFGMIADQDFENSSERAAITALRTFNTECADNGRFRATILPTGEGLTMAVKIK